MEKLTILFNNLLVLNSTPGIFPQVKMKCLLVFSLVLLLTIVVSAKKKNKFEGDFEFVDEVSFSIFTFT